MLRFLQSTGIFYVCDFITEKQKGSGYYIIKEANKNTEKKGDTAMKKKAGKKLYSVFEIYGIAVKAFRSASDLKKLRKSGVLTEKMQERVMLAVTSVNKCSMCSYAHTEAALKAGLDDSEIKSFVESDFPNVPEEESKAVMFGQYYAEKRGKIDKDVYDELVSSYGKELSKGILASARIIMLGNAMGIVFGSVSGRIHGRGGDSRSSILYEVAVIITLLPIMIFASLQALLLNILRVPKISFKKKKKDER